VVGDTSVNNIKALPCLHLCVTQGKKITRL
jgi:hypothetical protein